MSVPEDDLELAYRRRAIFADLARGAGGLALVLWPLGALSPAWPVAFGLAALGGLFAVFLFQTWRRAQLRVRLGDEGIAVSGPRPRRLRWRELRSLRLRWFGPRRSGAGWLDLELAGDGERIALTSTLEGFEEVLERAVAAAERNGVALEPVTRANLAAWRGRAARGPLRSPAGSSAPRG